jgi:hypothetical protein
MSKKDFKSTANAIINKRPATLEEALKAKSVEDLEEPVTTTARATRKNRKPRQTGNAAAKAKSKKAARLERAEKPVRKEVSITDDLDRKLKAARVALKMYENDIINAALAEYLQRRDKEIKTALKDQLGI